MKVVEIGAWNMLSTTSLSVVHGLTLGTVISIDVLILNDAGSFAYPIQYASDGDATPSGGWYANSANVVIFRNAASFFVSTSFDGTASNRGFVTIWYTV